MAAYDQIWLPYGLSALHRHLQNGGQHVAIAYGLGDIFHTPTLGQLIRGHFERDPIIPAKVAMGAVTEAPGRKTAKEKRQRRPKATATRPKPQAPGRVNKRKEVEVIDLSSDSDGESDYNNDSMSEYNSENDIDPGTGRQIRRRVPPVALNLNQYRFVADGGSDKTPDQSTRDANPASSSEYGPGWAVTNTPAGRRRERAKNAQRKEKEQDVEYVAKHKPGHKHAVNRWGFRVEPEGLDTKDLASRPASISRKAERIPKAPLRKAVKNSVRYDVGKTKHKVKTAPGASNPAANPRVKESNPGLFQRLTPLLRGDSGYESAAPCVKSEFPDRPAINQSRHLTGSEDGPRMNPVPATFSEPTFDLEGIPEYPMKRKTERLIQAFPLIPARDIYEALVRASGDYEDAQDRLRFRMETCNGGAQPIEEEENVKIKIDLNDPYFLFDHDVDEDPADPRFHRYQSPVKPPKSANPAKPAKTALLTKKRSSTTSHAKANPRKPTSPMPQTANIGRKRARYDDFVIPDDVSVNSQGSYHDTVTSAESSDSSDVEMADDDRDLSIDIDKPFYTPTSTIEDDEGESEDEEDDDDEMDIDQGFGAGAWRRVCERAKMRKSNPGDYWFDVDK